MQATLLLGATTVKSLFNNTMSSEAEEEVVAADEVCASCGTTAVDDVKLKKCACDLVKYCSVACQKNHRSQHKKACKKRLAELRDNNLFEQPDSSCYGECPICCLPQSIDPSKSVLMSCCSQLICNGCDYVNQKRESEAGLQRKCVFCREPVTSFKSDEEIMKHLMKRVKKNCPVAIREVGKTHYRKGDHETALKYYVKAAELGDVDAHYNSSVMHLNGQGVEKDVKKYTYYMEEAAIGGEPNARHYLGMIERNNGRYERARRHFIIAANLGYHDSLNYIKKLHTEGHASKEDYEGALRAYQAAMEATKSPEREQAEVYYEAFKVKPENKCLELI